jgi:hypothetical protein
MNRRTVFQKWGFRIKINFMYYFTGVQFWVLNTYLTIRYVLKHHKLPDRVSEEEATAVVKAAIERAKARGEW